MRNYAIGFAAILMLSAPLTAPAAPPAIYVVDADTVERGGVRYRLTGFDAPEIYHARCPDERQRGLKAAIRLLALMAGGETRLIDSGKVGKWRRKLATLTIDGQDVAQIAIKEGWGRAYYGRTKRQSWCPDAK